MTMLHLLLITPLLGALLLALVRPPAVGGWLNLGLSGLTMVTACAVAWQFATGGAWADTLIGIALRIDAFNVSLIVLTAFVGLTTAIFSRPYMHGMRAEGRIYPGGMRVYHSMYQAFMLTMLLALTTDNLGVLWVAVEGATLATVLLVSLYRTPEAIEAAWKYFILCGVGIALALFGTVLTYFAAQHLDLHVGAEPDAGLVWSHLHEHSAALDPTVMRISFVFILVGYGTKVGLVPMHQWLPDAHSEGPTPMSAVLSGLLLNVALYALIRFKMLVDGSLAATDAPHLAGALLMGFGLVSFLVAALFLHRQRDIKRLFSYSSIEHMGLMTFAFGVGGPLATFAGLLHMLAHSLAKSALFVTVGHVTHLAGTQAIDKIRGLIRTQPRIGWSLLIGVAAIAGFPPFGIFIAELLLVMATMASAPWLTAVLLLGLVIAFAGLFRHLHPMVYGVPPHGQHPVQANLVPVALHLALVLWLGLAIPALLAGWLDQATTLLSGAHLL
jgi:hydrogenase-4 component F